MKPLYLPANQGYWESTRYGINGAAGKYVVIADFDCLREVSTFEPLLEPLESQSALLAVLVQREARAPLVGRWTWWLIRLLLGLRLRVWLADSSPVCWAASNVLAKQLAKELPPGNLFIGAVHWVTRSGGRVIEVPFDACRPTHSRA